MKALVAAVLLLAARPAAAEPARTVTLAEVLAAAPKGPAAQVSAHEIAAAEALIGASRAWPNPSIHLETNRLTARLVAGAAIPLPIFGTLGASEREARAQAAAVRAEAVLQQRDVRRKAAAAWIALARAGGEVTAAAVAATQAAELERIALGRLDAGVGGELDVTAAGAARARADLEAAAARHTQEAASAELAGLLGWDPFARLEASGPLPTGTTAPIETMRAHLTTHPERTAAQRRITAAEATIAQVRSQRRPGLSIEGQVSADDPTQPGTDVLVALNLELPLFARIGDRARSAEATAAAERARLAVTDAELGSGLVAAYRRWQAASEKLAGLEKDVLPAQEKAATLSAQAYREGARDLASALQADRDLSAVRAEINGARADAATAWAELQLASGADLDAR